jgi:maltose alpha-D-glucosyltransferase/alpha-amylase
MIRSFDYASQTVLINQIAGIVQKEDFPAFQAWARYWSLWIGTQFLAAYLKTVEKAAFATHGIGETKMLLDVFLLEKSIYELSYELNNRPAWVRVPLAGILRILETKA